MSIKLYTDEMLFERLIPTVFNGMAEGDVSVESVAQQLSLSASQLNRRVKTATGQTASNFIMHLRIDEAKRQLSSYPRHTVGEVARQCGFASLSHFSHTFTRYEGISPMKFIEQLETPSRLTTFIQQQVEKATKINK